MKPTLTLIAAGLLLVGFQATAQTLSSNQWNVARIDASKFPPVSDQTDVTFDKDILPLFKASCVRCHGKERPRGGLRLDTLEGTLKGGRAGKMVVPGDSKKSLLVLAVAQIDDRTAMPPKRRMRSGASTPPPSGGNNAAQPPAQPGGPAGVPKQGPPAKPLTAAEVGLVRAWIDQGAK